MTKTIHNAYVVTFTVIVLVTFIFLFVTGFHYYNTSLGEIYYHDKHDFLKPSGIIGHGLGVVGSGLLIVGVFVYMVRKRFRKFSRIGYLKYWLEFHIFLCSLGPVLILFHTAFKFGGIVAISFWSMVAVVISGIIGRFIYIQIPRTIEGREMSLNEINNSKLELGYKLKELYSIDENILKLMHKSLDTNLSSENIKPGFFSRLREDRKVIQILKKDLQTQNLSNKNYRQVLKLIKNEIVLNRRIEWLVSMQNLLRYWHIAHLPFALIMLVIMIIHVVIAMTFGYKWIF